MENRSPAETGVSNGCAGRRVGRSKTAPFLVARLGAGRHFGSSLKSLVHFFEANMSAFKNAHRRHQGNQYSSKGLTLDKAHTVPL